LGELHRHKLTHRSIQQGGQAAPTQVIVSFPTMHPYRTLLCIIHIPYIYINALVINSISHVTHYFCLGTIIPDRIASSRA
jgi:hypothetical protein